jgi:hypothetical protein
MRATLALILLLFNPQSEIRNPQWDGVFFGEAVALCGRQGFWRGVPSRGDRPPRQSGGAAEIGRAAHFFLMMNAECGMMNVKKRTSHHSSLITPYSSFLLTHRAA